MSANTIPVTEFSNITANQTVVFKRTGTHFRVQLEAGASGHVVLRGLRLFGHVGGQTIELYDAAEPRVMAASTGTWGGDLSHVEGSDQVVATFSKPFERGSSWHSQKVDPGDWISITVELPEERELVHRVASSPDQLVTFSPRAART